MSVTPDLAIEIKSKGMDVVTMGHAYRVNGCVDIWFNGKVIFDKMQNKYHKHKNTNTLIYQALKLADHYGKQEAFSKTKGTDRITYQAFKHRENKRTAEYYHWKNDNKTSDDYLYFIKAGLNCKIGRSKNPDRRVKELRTGIADKAHVVLKCKNKGHMEKILHRCFSEYKTGGGTEWFYFCSDIEEFIKWVKKEG